MGNATGPRTVKGKARSSENAAKHWIESGRILPSEQEEAALLRRGFTEDFKPEGLAENEVIDDLVLNRLIKRRIDRAFTREFLKAGAAKSLTFLESKESTETQYWLRSNFSSGTDPDGQGARLSPPACVVALKALKCKIGERGPQLEEDLAALHRIYGDELTANAAYAMYLLQRYSLEQSALDETAQAKTWKSVLEAIQEEIARQEERQKIEANVAAIEFASDVQEPPGPAFETLLRYRSTNLREFKDLLDSLERVRRLRRSAA